MENSKKKVLITDDSEINRSILSDMLGEEFEIIEAENGIEAISPYCRPITPKSLWCCSISSCPKWTASRCWRS